MKKIIFADLHNHTTASDGDFTSQNLVDLAQSFDIKAIGITDHDTVRGLKTAVDAGKKAGIEVVCGVEVSIRFKRRYFTGTLHLLCYFSSKHLNDKLFTDSISDIIASGRGEKLVRARVAEINTFFGPNGKNAILKKDLAFDDIARFSDNASRRHFALSLNQVHGITDPAVINQVIGNDSPAYLPSGIDMAQAKKLMNNKRIITALAHPAAGSFTGGGHYKEVLPPLEIVEQIFPEFIEAGMNGLEVYYPGHTLEHQDLMLSWARKYNLLVTGGSDCHDSTGRPFGVQGIDRKEFEAFKAALEQF
ncbi:MAG: PHP domain-containing protein [Proteobacteria bacterium]|nr:PHP domain-containing protein [Pseudomonadota bacterium]MBU1386509.1 PHP domain-containing protein [Pseudomonadota bacterium]MBU1544620.1 PHP domain-containing protein [Pseudomonadota bacterium]MBU2431481.1 PHP domain-containing protein [Pseudomonadota bacterium]MBU2481401.1 PHP domain-containing protein [Pseudomonadota bacterium]